MGLEEVLKRSLFGGFVFPGTLKKHHCCAKEIALSLSTNLATFGDKQKLEVARKKLKRDIEMVYDHYHSLNRRWVMSIKSVQLLNSVRYSYYFFHTHINPGEL